MTANGLQLCLIAEYEATQYQFGNNFSGINSKNFINYMTENQAYRNPISECSFEWEDITVCLITLKNRHFVYFLLDGNTVNYIGRTSNLYQRLTTHKNHRPFNEIYLCEYKTKYQSIQAEKNLIRYYSPKLNVMHNKNYNI